MDLQQYLDGGPFERVGFVMKDGEVIEAENVCADPRNGAEIKGEDLLKYMPDAVATFHTHPGTSKVLTRDDYHGFLNWPNHAHYIIGIDGIAKYIVVDGEVVIES